MSKKIFTPLDKDTPEEEFTFKTKSVKEPTQKKNLISKFKTFIRKPKTKTQTTAESQTAEFNSTVAGGFDLTPIPNHRRGASFFVGVNRNAPLAASSSHDVKPKRGSISSLLVQCTEPNCSQKMTNFLTRKCDAHSPAPAKVEEAPLASMEKGIVKLYKTWSYSVDEESEDYTRITWNFIHEDSHYQTVLVHIPEDTIAPELNPAVIKISLNGAEIFNKKLEVGSESEKLRFTVSPEDVSFNLDYTIEPMNSDEYGFIYSFYINRSPFERVRLRWIRDKLKKQMSEKNSVKMNTTEMAGWKHFNSPVPDKGKDAVKSVFNFSVEGRQHEVIVEVEKKQLKCWVDKNQIDIREKTHCGKRGVRLIVRKPKKIQFFANFKPCEINMKRNEKKEREVELVIDGVGFHVFQWIINNL